MKLDLYFASRFARALAMVLGIFAGLVLMVQSVEEIRVLAKNDVGTGAAVRLALLALPASLYQMLPIVVLIATLTHFLGMARSSELVVARAAGRSAMRFLVPVLMVTFAFGALCVGVWNPLSAATKKAYETMRTELVAGESQVFSVSDEGLWLREGGIDGQRLIRATRSNFDGSELYGVTFLTFDAEGHPTRRMEAETARIATGEWQLGGVKIWPLAEAPNPEAAAETRATMTLGTTLTPDEIRDRFGSPDAVSIWDMPTLIARLDAAGFSARAYRMWFQTQLALPMAFVAMVLIGAGFTMRHTRQGGTASQVLTAVVLAFSFYFLLSFARVLGENGEVPIALAAWTPPMAVIFAALALLLHLEDG